MENQKVNLKVFLKNTMEAHRITIDQNTATNLTLLKEKLKTIFPELKDYPTFNITWKDSDGDEITIGNDEDVKTAFKELKTPVKILYVLYNEKDRSSNPQCSFDAGLNLNLKDIHSLANMASQYLGPFLETLNQQQTSTNTTNSSTDTNQENLNSFIQKAAKEFFAATQQKTNVETSQSPPSTSKSTEEKADASTTSSHNAKIEEALRNLEQMGFRNENGYLTSLLKSVNGNVLDVIKILTEH